MKDKVFIFKPYSESIKYGVGTYINVLAREVCKTRKCYIVELFFSDCKEFNVEFIDGCTVIRIPYITDEYNIVDGLNIDYKTVNAIWGLISPFIDSNTKTIFHFQTPFLFGLSQKIAQNNNFRIIYTIHKLRWRYYFNCRFKQFKSLLKLNENNAYIAFVNKKLDQEKNLCILSHGVIALTKQSRKYLIKEYLVNPKKIFLIKNGIEIKNEVRLNTHTHSTFNYLFVGRVCDEKGIGFILKAFDQLADDIPNINLCIAGGYEHLSFNLKNKSKVIFFGHVNKNKLVKLYCQADVGIIASINEESSYVALEMMKYKVPIICSDLSGLNEMFTHNVDSLKVNSYYNKNGVIRLSVKSMKEQMRKLYNDSILRDRLKDSALEKLKEQHDLELMVRKTNQAYDVI